MGCGRRLSRPLYAAAIAACAITIGCKKAPAPTEAPPEPAQAKPATHLAPDELLEGTDEAFELVLPRGAVVKHRFVDQVLIEATLPFDKLIAYIKAHVSGGTLSLSERKATFEHVHSKGSRDLRVVLQAGPFGQVRMDVRDITAPLAPILPDEESRWRAAGLSRDGKILNKTKLD